MISQNAIVSESSTALNHLAMLCERAICETIRVTIKSDVYLAPRAKCHQQLDFAPISSEAR